MIIAHAILFSCAHASICIHLCTIGSTYSQPSFVLHFAPPRSLLLLLTSLPPLLLLHHPVHSFLSIIVSLLHLYRPARLAFHSPARNFF
eukprot:747607-Hanusia_phi.AAC.1